MIGNLFRLITLILLPIACHGQEQALLFSNNLRLPQNNEQSTLLVDNLNGFLSQVSKPNKDNSFVDKDFFLETSALLDEIKGMNESGEDKKITYRCYLTNIDRIDSSDYLVQFSYLHFIDSPSILRASFRLIGHRQGDRYYFRSPLQRNTMGWPTRKIGNFIFHYNLVPNENALENYTTKAHDFDTKLHAADFITEYYCCNSFPEALQLLGVDYKSDYNGIGVGSLSASDADKSLDLIGRDNNDPELFDLHDLWHDRLHHKIPVSTINKPIDEGCAYLYGGSWGISWPEIFQRFLKYMGSNKDWFKAFNENANFGPDKNKHLYVAYAINALIVQKIETEKGFAEVMEFLSCGKKEPGDENYFKALEKITGINRSNFNKEIEELVEKETKK